MGHGLAEQRRTRLNLDQKRRLKASQIRDFVAAVGRKSLRPYGYDPNDRGYDPDYSRKLRRMSPEEFDRLVSADDDGA